MKIDPGSFFDRELETEMAQSYGPFECGLRIILGCLVGRPKTYLCRSSRCRRHRACMGPMVTQPADLDLRPDEILFSHRPPCAWTYLRKRRELSFYHPDMNDKNLCLFGLAIWKKWRPSLRLLAEEMGWESPSEAKGTQPPEPPAKR